MLKTVSTITTCALIIFLSACSRKAHPTETATITTEKKDSSTVVAKKVDSVTTIRPVVKKKPKPPIPQVIAVNDKAASRSVDGRYYYDLDGHRYWRNNKDGKYYLYNKSMNTDEAFKKPSQ